MLWPLNPIDLVNDDVAVLKKCFSGKRSYRVGGHSYGGAVITAAAAGNADVKALYIAAQ